VTTEKINKVKELKELDEKLLNVNRGILALEFDAINEIKNAPYLKQMYVLRYAYEKDIREIKNG
jgi:hypothetical protein|tara:strand:- start:525 stop:716 length:192 start_codon:yes stop_codon:yes gene_type:complete